MNKKARSRTGAILHALGVVLACVACLFPFLWQVSTSLKPTAEIYETPVRWFPRTPTLANYAGIFIQRPFATYLKNSAVVAVISTLVAVACATLAAYAIARLRLRGKMAMLSAALMISMFPGIVIVTPLFLFFRSTGLLNTYPALILPHSAFAMPLALWNLHAFFKDLPKELDESAEIDGANKLQILWRIMLPLAAPGIFTTMILCFIYSWNEFLFALTFTTTDNMRTVPVGIAMFQGLYEIPWAQIAAASVTVTLPLIAMVFILQRRIISGLTLGGVKE